MELDIDVSKLKVLEASFKDQRYNLQDKLRKSLPNAISKTEEKIKLLEQDVESSLKTKDSDFQMKIMGHSYGLDSEGKPQKKEAGEALLATAQTLGLNAGTIGEYRGFKMSVYMDQTFGKVFLNLQGATTYNIELGTSELGNLTRIENAINEIPKKLEELKGQLENYQNQIKVTEEELAKPFPYADELKEKSARLAQLNVELTMPERGQTQTPENSSTETENPEIKSEEPQKNENSSEIKAAYGIPESKPQITEQMIRDLKLIDGESIIYPNPRTDGQQFKGEILHVDKENGYCVQLVGKQSLFVHSLEKLERIPEVGENLKLSFSDKNHKATLVTQEPQTRTRCRK